MTISLRVSAGIALLTCIASCGSITTPGTPLNDFSSGNFSVNIVASGSCTSLADVGRNRNWKIGLIMTGSTVASSMQGWGDPATVVSQTTLQGTASGNSLKLTGYIIDTVDGCGTTLCYRAEGTITATQSGDVLNGTLDGVVSYDQTTCTATDHAVTFVRR